LARVVHVVALVVVTRAVALAGCGPYGTTVRSDTDTPDAVEDVPGPADVAGEAMPDAPDATPDAGPDGPSAPDAPDAPPPGPAIGDACRDNPDCGQFPAICALNFPGGYCTTPCGGTDCPSGSFCALTASGRYCYATCASASDCRPGYACATTDPRQCLPTGNVPMYGACQDAGQCASALCVTPLCGTSPCAGGICTEACSPTGALTCEPPGRCFRFGSQHFCARACTSAADCAEPGGTGGALQTCRPGDPGSFCSP